MADPGAISTETAMSSQDEEHQNLNTMPEEICVAIIKELDIASVIALRQTSRAFHRLADPHEPDRRSELNHFLLKAQTFTRWRNRGLACFKCHKVLPHHDFARGQLKGRKGPDGTEQHTRFCVQCGMDKGIYSPACRFLQNGIVRIVCRHCKQLRSGSFCKICVYCEECDGSSFSGKRVCEGLKHEKITAGEALQTENPDDFFGSPAMPLYD